MQTAVNSAVNYLKGQVMAGKMRNPIPFKAVSHSAERHVEWARTQRGIKLDPAVLISRIMSALNKAGFQVSPSPDTEEDAPESPVNVQVKSFALTLDLNGDTAAAMSKMGQWIKEVFMQAGSDRADSLEFEVHAYKDDAGGPKEARA